MSDDERFRVSVDWVVDLLGSRQAPALEPVAYRTSLGRLEFLWLGPVGFIGRTSPYIDFYLETFYVYRINWVQ